MSPLALTVLIIVICVVLLLVVSPCILVCIYTKSICKKIYEDKLVRSTPDKWQRECSCVENQEHLVMWNRGLEWRNNLTCDVREVMIENDGLKLYGEYIDAGSDKCVLVVPGRCETLMYSYFFAEGYKNTKVNFLLMDPRAHGKSEGKYSYCGIKEADDVLAWCTYAKKVLGNSQVILHGICVGASACFLAKERDNSNIIDKIIAEGCFTSFYESFRQHVICEKKPTQPLMLQLRSLLKKNLGIDIKKTSPIKAVTKYDIPELFIAGKRDVFSVPKETERLYKASVSSDKKLVWYEVGAHSHLRINNMEDYDRQVVDFIDNH